MIPFRHIVVAAAATCAVAMPIAASAQDDAPFVVDEVLRPDEKAIFATVESTDVVPARARNGGVVASLVVDEGDRVAAGQEIAVIGDEKLDLQLTALDLNIRAFVAAQVKAGTDLERAQQLFDRGISPRAQLDAAQAAFDAADAQLSATRADREVVVERAREGAVLAPAAGIVLTVAVTDGSVVLPGETVAEIAAEDYVLRIALPERHARFVAVGDPVRVDEAALSEGVSGAGEIVRVFPRVENGRVIADARVPGVGDFFVGERVRVIIRTEPRATIVVPEAFLVTRFGVDFVHVKAEEGAAAVAVQRGRAMSLEDGTAGVEILAGLEPGDELVRP